MMSLSNKRDLIVAVVAGCSVVPLWMIMDREPPYVRESGTISAVAPDKCDADLDHLPLPTSPSVMYPGSCLELVWKIVVRKNCPPDVPNNVHPSMTDSTGLRVVIMSTRGKFGTTKQNPVDPLITRYFRLPVALAPGPAIYESDSTYACNPTHYFWPVHVSEPKVPFIITALPK